VTCPSCNAENAADSAFCEECGTRLERSCGQCGASSKPGARFCRGCGAPFGPGGTRPERPAGPAPLDYTPRHLAERILQSKSALEGERKQVTVLFADLKGSMQLAEQLDPEEWRGVLERFFEILTEGVHRFEGTVNQYTGDGIMALFGAPIAHEDHAQRACYAALHLRGSLKRYADELRVERGLNFSVRMGINSGEVVVGKIGDDLRMDYTAQGHTVGLAQRMESLAEAGKALLASHTIELVEGYFELNDLGETRVAGVDAPVRIAELEDVGRMRTRLDRSRARGLSRFVGRDEEMARLDAALERALAGDGQVLGVVAEAGGGKSRLCHELAERCRARGIAVRSGTGVPHGRAVPLEPALEFYREIFGVVPDDDDAQARQKIAGLVAQSAPEELDALPLLFEFLRVPDPARPAPEQTPEARQRAVLELLRRMTVARSKREPALLLFEDLHWLDPQTEEFIAGLVDAVVGTRTLLVTNFRPEYRADWMGRTHYQQLALRPLDAEAAAELLADWLGPDPSLAGFAARVRDRTGGNPFFMEEVVQAQIESGALVGTRGKFRLERPIDSVDVPESVQSLLAARIDRLGEQTKRLLQTAAVIGDDFAEPLLGQVSGLDAETLRATLRELVQGEFLFEQSLYPELEFAFKHPLTREVAYGSLLGERRREVHAATAKAIEARAGQAADAPAALLAHHWEQAGRRVEAARWQVQAARQLGMARAADTLFHWRKVTELLESEPPTDEVKELLGEARGRLIYAGARSELPDEEVGALFEAALRDLGDGDSPARAGALVAYALARSPRGYVAEARELALEAAAISRRLGDPAAIASSLGVSAITCQFEYPARTVEFYREVDEICGGDPSVGAELGMPPLAMATLTASHAMCELGRGEEAEVLYPRLRAICANQDGIEQLMLRFVEALRAGRNSDLAGALEAARRCRELSQGFSNPLTVAMGHSALGRACWRAGRLDEAEQELERTIEVGLDRRLYAELGVSALALLSQLRLERGRIEAARQVAERGLRSADELGLQVPAAASRVSLARILLAERGAEGIDAARAELEQAESLARERGIQTLLALAQEAHAEIAALEGDPEARERALHEAARLHRTCGDRWAAERVESRLAS
jgi:class 3 adenylate cyclase